MTRHCAVLVLCGFGITAAQDRSFRVETKVVQVPVTVTDAKGRNVEGLTARDFTVLDDGVQQPITLDTFGTGVAPISLAIAIQTSGISTPALAKIRRIGGMIQPLVTGMRGEAAVLGFDNRVRWLQDFTPESENIQRAVKNLRPGSATQARMFDAVAEVAERMKQRKGRKVLLVILESRDRGSETKFERAMEAIGRNGIEVFGAHYSAYATAFAAKPQDLQDTSSTPATDSSGPDGPPQAGFLAIFSELARLGKTNAIQALTEASGGSDYPFLKERGVEKAVEKLGVEVHSQYILGFPQARNAAGMRQIEVLVPDRIDFRVRARRTYWAD